MGGKEGELIPIERFTEKYNERADRDWHRWNTARKLGIDISPPPPAGELEVVDFPNKKRIEKGTRQAFEIFNPKKE